MKRVARIKTAYTAVAAAALLTCIVFGAPDQAAANPKPGMKTVAEAAPSLSGKVVETMNAAGYTYVLLEKKGTKTWVAVPEMKVALGKEMAFQPGATMPNFTSPTLKRTFDKIVFSSGPASSASRTGSAPLSGGGAAGPKIDKPAPVKVEKAAGPNAYTVAEVFEKKAALDKHDVVIKGKVAKILKGIMGKNWIHLQDGTGNAEKGNNDLIATSQDSPSVGEIVTVKGTVYKDKDFGGGYKYSVVMEQASIKR